MRIDRSRATDAASEASRLIALRSCGVLDTEREPAFDLLTKTACELCDAPISLVSLVESDRQWFKSRVGIDCSEMPRDVSFCTHTIETERPLIVCDAREDERFAANVLVTGPPHIRFYAGFPLVLSDGEIVGTICVIDRRCRDLEPAAMAGMVGLAQQASALLEMRRRIATLEELHRGQDRLRQELDRARRASDAACEAKSAFLANMSHEIRTPLNGIIGMTDLVLAGELTEEQRELLETSRQGGKILLSLVNDILDFSKIEAGMMTLNAVPMDLAETARHAINMLNPSASAKGLVLEASIDRSAGRSYLGDPDRLQQVLINLVGNAVKFTDAGSVSVEITSRRSEGSAALFEIGVRDTGVGISAEKLAVIFDEFEQASESVGCSKGGTGLGLAISRRLVELMGGDLHVESVIDRGSRFWFTLPLRPSSEVACGGDRKRDAVARLSGRVLLAEDNTTNRLFVRKVLEHAGATCDEVASGAEAVEAVRGGRYSLVLMDRHMPGLDGLEATRRIRAFEADHRLARVPILAFTASAVAGERERCEAAGMDGFIAKPVTMEGLVKHLAPWIAAPSAAEECAVGARDEPHGCGDGDEADFDWESALQQCMDDAAFLDEMVRSFVGELPRYVGRISEAHERADATEVSAGAHALKGAAGAMRAGALARVSGEIEQHALTIGTERLGDRIVELERAAARCEASIRSRIDAGDLSPGKEVA